jgi:anti-sigma B factor antagonist
MNLEIEHKEVNGIQTLAVTGEIDAYTASQLRKQLLPLTEEQGAVVTVDLSGVDYMDSTGLGVFVAGLKSTKKHGSRLVIQGLTPRVERLFNITGLSEKFEMDREVKGGTT